MLDIVLLSRINEIINIEPKEKTKDAAHMTVTDMNNIVIRF